MQVFRILTCFAQAVQALDPRLVEAKQKRRDEFLLNMNGWQKDNQDPEPQKSEINQTSLGGNS